MGGGEPRGRAHGTGAESDDVPASRHKAFLFRVGLVPSRPIPAHCSRRSLPGCRGNFGALVGVLFLAGSGSYSLLACVQAASAPGFPANPDCVPSAGLWRVDVRCCSVASGTGVSSIMANAGEAERRQCVGGQCKFDKGVQSHLHPTGAFLYCPLSAHHNDLTCCRGAGDGLQGDARRRMLAANFSCDGVNCSGHGQCDPSRAGGVDHACVCDDGWDAVSNCSSPLNCDSLAGCSGHGICAKGGQWPCPTNQTSPCCLCDLGWSGPSCAVGECEFPIAAPSLGCVLRDFSCPVDI